MKKIGVLGATGYAGQQLVWLLKHHSDVKIEFVASHSYGGEEFSNIYGNYFNEFDKVCISNTEVENKLDDIDLLFIALPHGKSFEIAEKTQSGPVTINGEVDRIYKGVTGELVIDDESLGRKIRITSRGCSTAVVWNPWSEIAASMGDLDDDDYKKMICARGRTMK